MVTKEDKKKYHPMKKDKKIPESLFKDTNKVGECVYSATGIP